MRFFGLSADDSTGYTGNVDAAHKWGLPGVHCPTCGLIWSGGSEAYPAVDLSVLPEKKLFEKARPEPFEEFARLRELVRPLVPMGMPLKPGSGFGPLVGPASGTFGQLFMQNGWTLMVRREALERLQAAGVRGLLGCPMEVRFRSKKNPPELLELQIEPHGRLHDDCLPPDRPPPCPTCERQGITLPKPFILHSPSQPSHLDVYRLRDFPTVLIATERFVEAARRLELDGVTFQEVSAAA